MIHVKERIIACPPIILANKRTINANGLVKIPNNSITGIIGTGHLSQVGTGGHKVSFQYSLLPNRFTSKSVNIANINVMFILPVIFAPPGNIGNKPNKLVMNIKKKAVNKNGAYLR